MNDTERHIHNLIVGAVRTFRHDHPGALPDPGAIAKRCAGQIYSQVVKTTPQHIQRQKFARTAQRMSTLRIDEVIRQEGLDAFLERTKVKTSFGTTYPNLVLLKYDMINCDMSDPAVQQCRGVILDKDDDFRIISFPYTKFFNYGDTLAATINWETARVYEKLDGSLLTIYHYAGAWQVQSSGTVDAGGNVGFTDQTFAELFWETFHMLGYELPGSATYLSYMFEMMTPLNRIVVRHTDRRLVLHGARAHEFFGYEEVDVDTLLETAGDVFGWEVVKTFPLTSLEDALTEVEKTPGVEQEGYVVCDHRFNRIKIKSKDYVCLHHLVTGMSYRRLLEIVQKGDGEEFLGYFPEYKKEYEEVQMAFVVALNSTQCLWDVHHGKETQKEFALAVKDTTFSAALFQLRAGKVESIGAWFRDNDSRRMLKLLGLKDKVNEEASGDHSQ